VYLTTQISSFATSVHFAFESICKLCFQQSCLCFHLHFKDFLTNLKALVFRHHSDSRKKILLSLYSSFPCYDCSFAPFHVNGHPSLPPLLSLLAVVVISFCKVKCPQRAGNPVCKVKLLSLIPRVSHCILVAQRHCFLGKGVTFFNLHFSFAS
jgi:hypothetical protein